jgi:hypothetical protein
LPGNRFEALKGDRKGQYSIRINDQWRICFEWPTNRRDRRTWRLWITTREHTWHAWQFIQGSTWPRNLTP